MSNVILCPTRGGELSYPNQDRAIAIAKERGADLIFLYITNVQFLGLSAGYKVVDVEHAIEEMGDFMLTMAQERAEKEGVHTVTALRRGKFREALVDVIEEHEVATVVIGSSAGGTGVVTSEYVDNLVEEITCEKDVEFIVVDQGEVVNSYNC
jgi:nucleotide-binding universal stress UspA family protein